MTPNAPDFMGLPDDRGPDHLRGRLNESVNVTGDVALLAHWVKRSFNMEELARGLRDPLLRAIAFRLTLAAILALSIASGLGVQNPWWAAMATWMIGQPPRGLMLERSAAQLVGTLVGGSAALMISWSSGLPAELALLALWLAGCCGMANLMRHQRSYGAALAGLTAVVIVTLTAETEIPPTSFAAARIFDTSIGILSALTVGFLFGARAPDAFSLCETNRLLAAGLRLVSLALTQRKADLHGREAIFLTMLATTHAGAEDAAAGSVSARRRLSTANRLFATLLDLVALARMIRTSWDDRLGTAQSDMQLLRLELEALADRLEKTGRFDPTLLLSQLETDCCGLDGADALLHTFAAELRDVAQSHLALTAQPAVPLATRLRTQHDARGLRRAIARGLLAVMVTAAFWLGTGWESARFLVLGASIFTILFATLDEPLPLVRQGLIGGTIAAIAAIFWRLGVIPVVSAPWISVALALPLFSLAAVLQTNRMTMFVGLTFNMFFAVMARPVDLLPVSAEQAVAAATMLIFGVCVSGVIYNWILPMDLARRRRHLEASIRGEIAFVSRRAGTIWADRHLARLRQLVLELVLRAQADPDVIGDAIAALSVGHAAQRFGEIRGILMASEADRAAADECLVVLAQPLADPASAAHRLIGDDEPVRGRLPSKVFWLRRFVASELTNHARIFSTPHPPQRQTGIRRLRRYLD